MTGSTHELGQVAYEAYADAVDWTAFNGERIQTWDNQDPARRAAWAASAERVEALTKARIAAGLVSSLPHGCRSKALECITAASLAGEDTGAPAALTGCSSSQSADATASCPGGTCDGTGTLTLSEPPADAAPADEPATPEPAQSSDADYATGGTVPAPAQSPDAAWPASSASAAAE